MTIKHAKCWQKDCFAYKDGYCEALEERLETCSFYKTDGRITNGKYYPFIPSMNSAAAFKSPHKEPYKG